MDRLALVDWLTFIRPAFSAFTALCGVTIGAYLGRRFGKSGEYVAALRNLEAIAATKEAELRVQYRIATHKEYLEAQIRDYYGPIDQLVLYYSIGRNIRTLLMGLYAVGSEEHEAIRRYIRNDFFFPTFNKIEDILTTRSHLAYHPEITEPTRHFIRHSLQNRMQHSLYTEHVISTLSLPGTEFPEDFAEEVRNTLHLLKKEYDSLQGRTPTIRT